MISGDRGRVLPNRNRAAGRECQRKFSQRAKSSPGFRRIAQDPFYRACFIIDAYEEISPTRNDQGVIRPIVRDTVVMEPIGR